MLWEFFGVVRGLFRFSSGLVRGLFEGCIVASFVSPLLASLSASNAFCSCFAVRSSSALSAAASDLRSSGISSATSSKLEELELWLEVQPELAETMKPTCLVKKYTSSMKRNR